MPETEVEQRVSADPHSAQLKPQIYKDERPKEYFDQYHEWTRTHKPDWVYPVVRMIATVYCGIAFRARCIAANNVPASGPVVIAPNHFSNLDHFFAAMFIRRQVHFMAKSQLFKLGLRFIFKHGGCFPVRRGHRDEEAFITAETILDRGDTIVMYCEGGRSRSGELGKEAKPGIGRIALQSGAPVVPVAILSAGVRNWKRLKFPSVTVYYGNPIQFECEPNSSRERQQEVADQIFTEIRKLYDDLQQNGAKAIRKRLRSP